MGVTTPEYPAQNILNGIKFELFSDDEIRRIDMATRDVLETYGVQVSDVEGREIFKAAGCPVDEETQMVKIPGYVLDRALSTVPKKFYLYGRDESRTFTQEWKGKVHYTCFGTGIQVCDYKCHGKYETIATSIIGLALMAVAVKLGWDGIRKILHVIRGGELQSPGIIALIAAITSTIAKEWIYRVTHRVARQVESQALEANAWHHRSDAFSSIGTAIGIGGAVALGSRWTILDPIAAVIVSIMISITALKLIRKSSGELLEESLPQETEQQIVDIVYQDPLVTDVHRLHTRRIGNIIAIEMHLRLPKDITLEQAHTHATAIERHLRDTFGSGTHIMLHIEPTKP